MKSVANVIEFSLLSALVCRRRPQCETAAIASVGGTNWPPRALAGHRRDIPTGVGGETPARIGGSNSIGRPAAVER
jgi:hypothetical protein